jgi:alpha-soluble NSF attachment protein
MAAKKNMEQMSQARKFIADAKAAENKFAWFGSTSKYEEAGELYSKAGNCYKMAKSMTDAGDAYMQSYEAFMTAKNTHEANLQCQNAAKAYRKTNPTQACKALEKTIQHSSDQGRFAVAAKYQQEIAEIYESEGNISLAIENYQIAADLFEGENQVSSSNKCLIKLATMSAEAGEYVTATKMFEKVAENSLDNSLLVWGCKDHFMKATMCVLAQGDFDGAKMKLEQYCSDDNRFASSRECTLVLGLTTACLEGDVKAYTDAVVKYDAVSPLDAWKTSILLKIKNILKERADGIL